MIKRIFMLQESVIREIILWIEQNLESRLSLDIVAEKAGYTKWHFQRIFKSKTGLALGTYIRARRLSCAAVALRLTNDSVMDISLRYRFDSQQTFCRAFKKQFKTTPSEYRRQLGWNVQGFCLPIRIGSDLQVEVRLTKLPAKQLIGMKHCYSRDIPDRNINTLEIRREYWRRYLEKTKKISDNLYAIHGLDKRHEKKEQDLTFYYTTGLEKQNFEVIPPDLETVELPAGDYLELKFSGSLAGIEYDDIIYTAYGKVLPNLDIMRKESCDVENYVLKEGVTYDEFMATPHNFIQELNYYIPVIV
ncbi:helix-turn-helix domain-containing protein [Moellerella wisconsensis]|uniref:helix-turn-helix domain-containing protein n=1 Tax=Moellerella wisconsensis TaxID=158849 RepID=UPI001F4E82CA|nr:helix-turn-helix domain-containing protein [Moellerella wisconsensis]UNH41657.1 helix-turn-helix domain-containing protein [Moellerella wisconsensis]